MLRTGHRIGSDEAPQGSDSQESELATSLTAARSIVQGLYEAAILLSVDFEVIEFNGAYAAMTGLRASQLRKRIESGANPLSLISEASGEDERAARTCVEEGRSVHLAEREVVRAEGPPLLAWLSFLPIFDEDNRVIAVLEILRDVTGDAQAQAKLKELLNLTKARAQDLERAVDRRTQELRAALEDVTRLSRTDPLTGLLNRRAFTELAQNAIARSRRHDHTAAVIMCDLDHFKRVNDVYGHNAGDRVLKAVSECLTLAIRETDHIARFGGEEFVILLTEPIPEAIMQVAKRLKGLVRNLPICEIIPGADRPQTVSLGVAVFPEHGRSLDQLLSAADAAMYVAKQEGRDRVVLFNPALSEADSPETSQEARVLLIRQPSQERDSKLIETLEQSFEVVFASSSKAAATFAMRTPFDAVVCDERVFDEDGVEVLKLACGLRPSALRILVVDSPEFDLAVRATHLARVDHFLRREEVESRLITTIHEGLARRETLREQLVAERSHRYGAPAARGRIVRNIILERAIDFAFQVIMDVNGEQVFAREVLCRPQTAHRLNPADLFDMAVRSGEIWPLGRLNRQILAEQIPRFSDNQIFFVNLHPAELEDPMLESLDDPLLPFADRIVFEVTERAAITNFDHFRDRIRRLKSYGYRFAVDDLGAGYASLSSIALLEPDFLKIDMSITRGVHRDDRRRGLIQRIVDFANEHSIRVVSEGIETIEEAHAARELGSHLLQGYFFGRPEKLREDLAQGGTAT